MLGTGLGHYIPLVAYLSFWVMMLVSIFGQPKYGLYYAMPFIPYRTMRDKFLDWPLGAHLLLILIVVVIVSAVFRGKRLPRTNLYLIWFIFGVYLYFSMWFGTAMTNAPAPLWLGDANFVTWKDYMVIPLVFAAAGLTIEDRASVRTVVILIAFSLAMVDRSTILENLTHSWVSFDESKRTSGPLAYGSNQLAAFLVQFGLFFWGFGRLMKRRKAKLICYALVAATIFADLYTFSRASYLALLAGVAVLALLRDRKLLLVLPVFLLTWRLLVPVAVTERVDMTHDANGQLDASAEERVKLWENAKQSFYSSPLLGNGFATFQYGEHVDNLADTHNWYVKVLVETGVIGGLIALVMLAQMISISYKLSRTNRDPLYTGLGLGTLLAVCSCIVANCFGDRWTYLEINGLLWVLIAAVARAQQLIALEAATAETPLRLVPSMEWQ